MKQLKVRNPKLQRVLDYFTGWKEVALVIGVWIIAILLVVWATKVSIK